MEYDRQGRMTGSPCLTGSKLMSNTRTRKRGFTLVEIMIVVLIIGILLAIAIPNFINARQTSRVQTIVANLREVDAAKEHEEPGGAEGQPHPAAGAFALVVERT